MGFEPTYRHPIALTRPLRLGSANYNRSRQSQPYQARRLAEALDDVARFVDKVEPLVSSE